MAKNRLSGEKSPYLLQHQENPVDWYPWGEEAFAKARAEDKPIFLSIGYSTCHWCHVMERESFEDPAIAALMNASFVNVKVDREERPDVDRVYMAFVQATTGGGGWPMSVWLTPALKPFYGGTYFPPRDAYGRPGFPTVLQAIASAWAEKRADILASGDQVIERMRGLEQRGAPGGAGAAIDRKLLENGFRVFAHAFDPEHAGFGKAPKFPRPVTHQFLLRWFARTGDEDAAAMVIATLDRMALGGIYDHLGGGFHRYSVDRTWHVPHFEKMLYDQAQLVTAYLEAYQVCHAPSLARVARETCDYVLRDLCDAATGGFYSAEDADSAIPDAPPGSHARAEGAFYVFTNDELTALLGADAPVFAFHYGIEPGGNAQDPHGELIGKNVLHVRHTVEETAAQFQRTPADVDQALAACRSRLFAARARRPRPHLDDKVLCAWNGMMIGALARAGAVLDEPRYLAAATRAATFVTQTMYDPATGVLRRRWRAGEAAIDGYLEDYAQLADGLFELYQATFEPRWLRLAEELTDHQIARFGDDAGGGFFATTGADPSVLLRMKDDHDGAEPSGNSVAALNLLRLAHLLDRPDFAARAEATVRAFAPKLREYPHAMPLMLVAAGLVLDPPSQVVLAGERNDAQLDALLRDLRHRFLPDQVRLLGDEASRAALGARLPWFAAMTPLAGRATAYVCKQRACDRPVTDVAALRLLTPAHEMNVQE